MRSLVPYTKQASRQDIPTTTCSNVFCLEQADLKVDLNYPGLPKPRTEKMLMIEVLVSSGTDTDRKTRLLAALVEALDGAGTDPNDIMVFFGEIDRANSSFGGGRLAPPVARV
jgi:hypothetical protein